MWQAYKRVKANGGAAGADGVSLKMFEQDLSKNLYRLWNRMSSGSYFAAPVKRMEIPKADGKVRPLGIPTVADRIAQMVVKNRLEPELEPLFHADSYGYGPGVRRTTRYARRGNAALPRRGCWTWTSRGSSTTSTGRCC